MTTPDDKERLLSILHAHGQQFLSSFDISAPKHEANDSNDLHSESEEEWTGFGSSTSSTSNADSDDERDRGAWPIT